MNPQQYRPTRSSSICMLTFISFLIIQTAFMLLGLSLSVLKQTFFLAYGILEVIYFALKDYYLTVFAFLILFLLQKLKVRMSKCIGSVVQSIMDPHIQCYLCHQRGDCDWNCKNCCQTYHQGCLYERGLELRCQNPACGEIIFNEHSYDFLQFIRTHQRQALYVSLIFVIIGLLPTFKATYSCIDQLIQL